jgi:hypothetical protein
VVTVGDEVQVADPVHVNGRDRLAAPLGQGEPLPAFPYPAAGGAEAAVEVPAGVHRADDGLQPDDLQAQPPLTPPAEGREHLVERKDEADVIRGTAQPLSQPGQHLAAADAQEVIRYVGPREPGARAH